MSIVFLCGRALDKHTHSAQSYPCATKPIHRWRLSHTLTLSFPLQELSRTCNKFFT